MIPPKSKMLEIYHIDGDAENNNVDNLIELSSPERVELNSQLQKIALSLVKKGLVVFDNVSKRYILSPVTSLQLMEKSFGFENIAIKQKKNICQSRLDVNIESEVIRGIRRPIPIIASNMSTVTNASFYIKIFKLGGLAILHRADTSENILESIRAVSKECDVVAASIGVDYDQFDFAKLMIRNGCNVITIDIAHGYSDYVLNIGKKIKQFSPSTKIILGNTTNVDLLHESYDFADAIKVGIAQGLACETKNTAGCTEKQFSAVLKFKHISKKFGMPIISDGGIREPADFTKAIAAGANSVMIGSVLAACPESAAETVVENYKTYKLYAGMASEYVQNKWKGGLKPGTCAEGGVRLLPVGDLLEDVLTYYSGALRSGITYSGNNNISSFQDNVEFVML